MNAAFLAVGIFFFFFFFGGVGGGGSKHLHVYKINCSIVFASS